MAIITEYSMVKIYTAVMLSLFDEIQLNRRELYTIPITFGSKERLYQRLYEQQTKPDSITYSMSLPAFSLEFNGVDRNLERQTNRLLRKTILQIDDNNVSVNWNDTSVDLQFTLHLISKSMTEMTQVIEYVISSFKNGLYYVDVKSPLYQDPISTPIILDTAQVEIDMNEEVYEDTRVLETSFDMTLKGILHNNVVSNSTIIKQIDLNMYLDLEYKKLADSYKVLP